MSGDSRRLPGVLVAVPIMLVLVGHALPATPAVATRPTAAKAARAAAQMGMIAYKLTDPDELRQLLGDPLKQERRKDGDGQVLILQYPGVRAVFARPSGEQAPFVLWSLSVEGQNLDIGRDRLIVLRNQADLYKFDRFWGVANASLATLDLTSQLALLNELPFDSRTVWPPADRLPRAFHPARLLEEGKNPGLGVRGLHKQGIDGRGVHIAIIDQPLFREHREYKAQLASYEGVDVDGVEPQMHGPPVTSIAVGRTCGVAPQAVVHYYAVPTWKWWDLHCEPYAALLERIVDHSRQSKPAERIRVVSLSLGAFSQWPDYARWEKAVRRAADEGILVVTCDPAAHRIGTLNRDPAKDPEDPLSYRPGKYSAGTRALLVPAGNRSTASHHGPEIYTFWCEGGMSWAVPYLAGLAALARQVNPGIEPQAIVDLWQRTASKTDAGRVVNPVAFIEEVRKARKATRPVP